MHDNVWCCRLMLHHFIKLLDSVPLLLHCCCQAPQQLQFVQTMKCSTGQRYNTSSGQTTVNLVQHALQAGSVVSLSEASIRKISASLAQLGTHELNWGLKFCHWHTVVHYQLCFEFTCAYSQSLSGDQTGHIRVWDLTASACSCELVPEIGTAVRSLTVALDGTMIVAANNNGTCYVWRMMRGEKRDVASFEKSLESEKTRD